MKIHKLNNASGDTIVEVIIVLAVLSMSFAISYATANTGLTKAQTSQEHSQALGYLNSQVELLRTAIIQQNPSGNLTDGTQFCINEAALDLSKDIAIVPISAVFPAECLKHGRYSVIVKYIPATTHYELSVTWDGLGTLGVQHEELTYKVQSIIPPPAMGGSGYQGSSGGYPIGNNAPAVPSGGGGGGGGGGPPPAPPYSWTARGSAFSTCTPPTVDPDGCFINAPLQFMYARRLVDVRYMLDTFAGGPIKAGTTATLTINYNQYAGSGTSAPAGYPGFILTAAITDSIPHFTQIGPLTLPIEDGTTAASTSASYASHTFTKTFTMPYDNPATFEFVWTNNIGLDPDLQINSISITSP